MQADFARRRMVQGIVAAMVASSIVVAGPAAPQAHAGVSNSVNPCNAPGGKWVCDKAEKGTKWLYDKSGAESVVEGASAAVDFATDPLGYFESKLRSGTRKMFESFGEKLTGKKTEDDETPAANPKGGNP
ncbi:hypothetical protein [Streptomyces sp. NPDC056304]|uniref:hypothetical protein n=1 Tax=Streptomyces sp. NPDC056304 TaxID=3345778 RepID=UPI0035E2111B